MDDDPTEWPCFEDRRDYETLFDLMEGYRSEHPDATDDECFEAVCFGNRQKDNTCEQY